MANDPSAEPTVTLTADARPFIAALDRAAASMESWGKKVDEQMKQAARTTEQQSAKMSQSLSRQFEGLVGKLDKVTSVMGLGVKGAILAAALAVSDALIESVTGAKEFEKQLLKVEEANRRVSESFEKQMNLRKEWLDIGEGTERTLANINAEIQSLQEAQSGFQASLAEAEASRARRTANPFADNFASGPESSAAGFWKWTQGKLGTWQKDADMRIENVKKRITDTGARLEELGRKAERMADRETDPEFVRKVNEMTASLKKQADTWGMNADQIALYDLKLQGATKNQLEMVEAAIKAKDEQLKALNEAAAAAAAMGELGRAQFKSSAADWSKTVSANVGGSQGGANAIIAAMRSTNVARMDPQKEVVKAIADLGKLAAENNKKMGEIGRDIARMTELAEDVGIV